jgi:predicted ribosomally synthesized peptide with SipW-like signal peptide
MTASVAARWRRLVLVGAVALVLVGTAGVLAVFTDAEPVEGNSFQTANSFALSQAMSRCVSETGTGGACADGVALDTADEVGGQPRREAPLRRRVRQQGGGGARALQHRIDRAACGHGWVR